MSKKESIDLKNYIIDPNVLSELPLEMMEKNNIIPFKKEKNILYVATNTPEDFEMQSMIETETGQSIRFVYSNSGDIKAAILSRLKIRNIFGSLEEPDAEFKSVQLLLNVVK